MIRYGTEDLHIKSNLNIVKELAKVLQVLEGQTSVVIETGTVVVVVIDDQ